MYIVVDGIDGCGKTTIIEALSRALRKLNITSICVHEPTNGVYGLAARRLVEGKVNPPTSKLHKLFTQDREDHVRTKINPALHFISNNPEFCLLQDRGYLSASAYQAEDDSEILSILDEQRLIAPSPDFFFLIDTPVSLALKRIATRSKEITIFDREKTLKEVRRRFLILAKSGNIQMNIINGTLPIEEIVDKIIQISGFVVESD